MLFSATMPAPIRALAKQYMREPVEVHIEAKRITLDEIEQVVIETSDRDKQAELIKLIQQYNPYLAMVFCRTKKRAGMLNKALQELGMSSDELHGDLSQAKREQVMKRFREAKIQILVATDMAARGIDVEGITHVFNYDIPHDVESYIHRIGRTGRAGKKGMAITFATSHDRMFLEQIERGTQQSLGGEQRTKQGGTGRNGERSVGGNERSGRTAGAFGSSGGRRGAARSADGSERGARSGGTRGASTASARSIGARGAAGGARGAESRGAGEGRNDRGARSEGRAERGPAGGRGRAVEGTSGRNRASEPSERSTSGRQGSGMQLREARSEGGARVKRDGGNFGNAASRVRGGEAQAGPRGAARGEKAAGRSPRREGSEAATAARPIGLKGKVAAAKNEAAWGRIPEGENTEAKRDRPWHGKGKDVAIEQRSARPAASSQERDPKPARGSKIPRGATNPYSPYTASNGRKDSKPQDGAHKNSARKDNVLKESGGPKRTFNTRSPRKGK
jgi:ATP-dependent RNA helicase DeaD